MRSWCLFLLTVLFAACNSAEKPHELTLADIRFPDPEREAIVANGIAHVIAYDTAEFFNLHPKGRAMFGRNISHRPNDTFILWGSDHERRLYDTSGNEIFHYRSNSFGIRCGTGLYPHQVFDSCGRLRYNWSREPERRCDTFWYRLTKPDNIFLKIHHSFREGDNSIDTTIYTIDAHGRPVKGTHYSRYWDYTCWKYAFFDTVWFTYQDKLLVQKKIHCCYTNEIAYNSNLTETYFYKNGLPDSFASLQEYPNKRGRTIDIHEYVKFDEYGLPLRGLIADSLHVFYKFKKHGDPTIPDYRGW